MSSGERIIFNHEEKPSVELASHPFLDEVSISLRETHIDWYTLHTKFMQTEFFESFMKQDLTPSQIVAIRGAAPGILMEFYVGEFLRSAASNSALSTEFTPIKHDTWAYPFEFNLTRGNRVHIRRMGADSLCRDYGDYDDLVELETPQGDFGLFVVETKIANARSWQSTMTEGRKKKRRGTGLVEVIKGHHINKLMAPLQAFSDTNPQLNINSFGLMVVTNSDAIREAEVQRRFRQEYGGYLTAIPATSLEFRTYSHEMMKR